MWYKCTMDMITGENDKGRRLDRILRKSLPNHSLALIHRLIRQKQVFVDGKAARAEDRICSGAMISIPSLKDEKNSPSFKAPKGALSILWEDLGLLALNKPPGLAVHGSGSLDEMVRSYLKDKLPPSLSFRPGPQHRLDKPSSGIVVFSTSLDGARLFSSLLHEQRVRKIYLAVVEGKVKNDDVWEDNLSRDKNIKKTFITQHGDEGKKAVTKITPLAVENNFSLIQAEILTGRTHQIRAQASAHGHPLAGDKKYGGSGGGNFFLHAWKLEFLNYSIEAPLPESSRYNYHNSVIALLRSMKFGR